MKGLQKFPAIKSDAKWRNNSKLAKSFSYVMEQFSDVTLLEKDSVISVTASQK